jgi:hypothetical protein
MLSMDRRSSSNVVSVLLLGLGRASIRLEGLLGSRQLTPPSGTDNDRFLGALFLPEADSNGAINAETSTHKEQGDRTYFTHKIKEAR